MARSTNFSLGFLGLVLSLSSNLAPTFVKPGAGAQFQQTGSLITGRIWHTETLLSNGKVLVAGGAGTSALTSAELYDPARGTWKRTGSLTTGRSLYTAT